MTKCLVGQVVFGTTPRAGAPGADEIDGAYFSGMFLDSAGLPSWADIAEGRGQRSPPSRGSDSDAAAGQHPPVASETRSVRKAPYAPMTQSNVDQVVFGEATDTGLGIDYDYMDMHSGAAGHPSWIERPQGLSSSFSRRMKRELNLRTKGRDVLARLLGPRGSSNSAVAHILPHEGPTQKDPRQKQRAR